VQTSPVLMWISTICPGRRAGAGFHSTRRGVHAFFARAQGIATSEYFVCTGEVCVDGKCVSTGISIQLVGAILLGTRLLKKLGKTFVLD
jgi:hypothetical protein